MIKFLDLQAVNGQYADELKQAAVRVIDSGWYLGGVELASFTQKLKEYTGAAHVIPVANGLEALRLIVRAYKEMGVFKDGDQIIVPGNTFIASVLAITDNGLEPIFVEPSEHTYNLDLDKIEAAITPRTVAIMPVHLCGRVVWSNELERLAAKYNLKIIEDNAQSIGAKWHGKHSGTLGDAAGFSFYPGKNLGALGDSGAVTTKDEELARIVHALANYGSDVKYVYEFEGFNSRMSEIQAAFLGVKIDHIDGENAIRRTIANYYCQNIKNPNIILPEQPVDPFEHVYHTFVIRCANRDALQDYLTKRGVQTIIHYPIAPHKQKCYDRYSIISLPITERLASEVLSLPISPVMTAQQMQTVVEIINKF